MKISAVMALAHPQFLAKAIEIWQGIDWPEKELIVVADASSPVEVPEEVRVINYDQSKSFGQNLNSAVTDEVTGEVVHKYDDDDWYAKDFYQQAMRVLEPGLPIPKPDLVWWDQHMLYFTARKEYRFLGQAQMVGSLLFRREVFDKVQFEGDPPVGIGFTTRVKKAGFKASPISFAPKSYVDVRHGANLWNRHTTDLQGSPRVWTMDEVYLGRSVAYPASVMPQADEEFYQRVAKEEASHV